MLSQDAADSLEKLVSKVRGTYSPDQIILINPNNYLFQTRYEIYQLLEKHQIPYEIKINYRKFTDLIFIESLLCIILGIIGCYFSKALISYLCFFLSLGGWWLLYFSFTNFTSEEISLKTSLNETPKNDQLD